MTIDKLLVKIKDILLCKNITIARRDLVLWVISFSAFICSFTDPQMLIAVIIYCPLTWKLLAKIKNKKNISAVREEKVIDNPIKLDDKILNNDIMSNNYTIIDIETTGLSKYKDEIIEISAIKIRNNEIYKIFSTLVNPKGKISKKVSKINSITNDMVKNSPSIEDILPDFIKFVEDDVLVAHNANFDLSFIVRDAKLNNINFNPYYVDTLEYVKDNINIARYRLVDVMEYFDIKQEQSHRALDDCKLLFECFKHFYLNRIEIKQYKMDFDLNDIDIKVEIKKIKKNNSNIIQNIFTDKNCVITGDFEKYKRNEVIQTLVNCGAIYQDNVTLKTNFLICGDVETGKGKTSKANEYIAKGKDIEIINEQRFYKIIEELKPTNHK